MAEYKYTKNAELIELSKNGDRDAMEELVETNMGLVKNIAARFRGRGAEYEDLVQIGVIGLMKAVKSFDKSYNTVFSTYAVPMILGEIKRHLRDDSMIKVSRDTKKRGIHIMKVKEEFKLKYNREPRASELCELTGYKNEDIIYALDAVYPVYSLSESGGWTGGSNGDSGTALENYISSETDEIEETVNSIALRQALDLLPELQRELIILRYFKNLSQQQTAKILNLTQVKVSREEKKIFEKLKKIL